MATGEFEFILSVDVDDPELQNYRRLFSDCIIVEGNNRSVTDAVQKGCKIATGEMLMIFSDDFETMPSGWDWMIKKAVKDKEFYALKVYDEIHRWIHTIPIIDRKLYEYLGHIYNPIYLHMFGDTELACIGDLLDITITRNDIRFPHHQFTRYPKTKDHINDRNNSFWVQDEKVFLERWKNNFGLRPDQIKGRIKDTGTIAFVKGKIGTL